MTIQEPTYSVVSNPHPEQGELQILFAGSSQTKPLHRVGPKVVDYFLIHYVEEGRGTFISGTNEYALGAGDSFVIFPDALVSYVSDEEEPWRYRWIAFQGEGAQRLVESAGFAADRLTVHTARHGNVRLWFERVRRTFAQASGGTNLRAGAYLQLLLAEYADAWRAADLVAPSGGTGDPVGDRLVRQAIHYLSAQYAEPISIELMSESLGYNRAYLSRLFKKRTGVSPVTFLVRLRLDRARRLLRERAELTVEQVAFSVGFADALYFSKQFKRAYGESPTEYRSSVMRTAK
jgi:AraC-like DNA-binding protein